MNEKLAVKNIEDVPKIISEIVKIHGNSSVENILDGLLNEYTHELLIDIIKNKVPTDKKARSQNNNFIVGHSVYRHLYDNECGMQVAISHISEKSFLSQTTKSMTENTIKTHLDNFRTTIREDMRNIRDSNHANGKNISIKEMERFIYDFYRFYDRGPYVYWSYEYSKKSSYKQPYDEYIAQNFMPF